MTTNLGPRALSEIQTFQNTLQRFTRGQRIDMIRFISHGLGLSVSVSSPATTPVKRKATKSQTAIAQTRTQGKKVAPKKASPSKASHSRA